jgi:predicted phage terminase large subunit-like protein
MIRRDLELELARKDFFYYCNLLAPGFYKEDRRFLKDICEQMQDFYFSSDDVLIINVPPRHGKSRSAVMFTQWVFGQNVHEKVMTGSYNETLSTTFSKSVRNAIQEVKADENITVYSDVFPDVKIKQGDGAMNLWSLEGSYSNYLATSPTGTATGFGASLMIIDDLIKNSEEAFNENVLEKHWSWFTNTMLSRLEENGKVIIIMTRWSSNDLAGKALDHFNQEHKQVRHISLKAYQDDGSMLCDDILSKESYEMKVRAMGLEVASANYQQIPIDLEGKLYKNLKTYVEPPEFTDVRAYIDTADTGSDYLCAIVYGVYSGEAYILDVLHTIEGMEVTEPATAKLLHENGTKLAIIESNNGGRGFARNVESLLYSTYQTRKPSIKQYHQSKNKLARILSNSTFVMDHIYFPVNWRDRWPEFYKAITTYQKEGRNKHDDAPDALTGVAENVEGNKLKTMNKSILGL